jgi:sulfur carrier protein ThiS
MTVTIKYSVRDLVGDMRDGAYEIPEETTVEALISVSEKEAGKTLSDDVKQSFIFLVNSKPASWETVLKDGDKLRVLYKILGG